MNSEILKMKKLILLLLLALPICSLYAQHCPFDGSYAIVITTDKKTTALINSGKAKIILEEIENPQAEKCHYAEGMIKKPFAPVKEALIESWDNRSMAYSSSVEYLENSSLLQSGNYAVKLNMAQESCMIAKGNDYDYVKRKFQIVLKKEKEIMVQLPVAQEKIYSLCKGSGKWSRIEPLEIKKKK